ncbi:caspase family protein [bacterium]|nr:caspase family protein [bacterium]NDC93926.1 caspase family protein [bacterium]NDD83241.1 caspase family protein [bacterium]NDG28903.1 caspase family protein [bacterium]
MSKKALLIGINYTGSSAQLNGCVNDITNVRKFLLEMCGFQPQNIVTLTDAPDNANRPTRKAMEDQIGTLARGAKSGDTLVFYYSGHGSNVPDNSNDESDGKDEVLVPMDYMRAGVITDDWLNENLVKKIPQNAVLYAFTDCCHSGTMCDLKYNVTCDSTYKKGQIPQGTPYVPGDWTDKFSFTTERAADTQGTVILFSGCRDPQTSADASFGGQGQGAFTHCFLDTMKANRNRTVGDILKEINCKLILSGFEQRSQLSVGKISDINFKFNL